MEYPIKHPRFRRRSLSMRTSIVGTASILVEGQEVKGKAGLSGSTFQVADDDGQIAVISLKPTKLGFGAIVVVIDGETPLDVMEPLPWYAYVFAALPFALMVTGGALGGALGAFAGVVTMGLFRSESPMGLKILGSVGITLFSGMLFFFLVSLLHMFLGT